MKTYKYNEEAVGFWENEALDDVKAAFDTLLTKVSKAKGGAIRPVWRLQTG